MSLRVGLRRMHGGASESQMQVLPLRHAAMPPDSGRDDESWVGADSLG